jgi:RHS repeat-associated protein
MGQRVQKVGAGLYAPSTTATINATTGQSPQGISLNFNARFVYDEQGRIIGEYANDGKLISETIWFNDSPIATLRPKGSNNQIPLGTPGTTATQANNVGNNTTANKVNVDIYYVHPDHLDTPRVVTRSAAIGAATTGPNAINKQVWSANTDPFGSSLGNSAPNENPQLVTGTATVVQAATFRLNHRFPGQSFDAESGKSDNWMRTYDPIGRYTQSDPIGLDEFGSVFAYVGSDPMSYIDSNGEKRRRPPRYRKPPKPEKPTFQPPPQPPNDRGNQQEKAGEMFAPHDINIFGQLNPDDQWFRCLQWQCEQPDVCSKYDGPRSPYDWLPAANDPSKPPPNCKCIARLMLGGPRTPDSDFSDAPFPRSRPQPPRVRK